MGSAQSKQERTQRAGADVAVIRTVALLSLIGGALIAVGTFVSWASFDSTLDVSPSTESGRALALSRYLWASSSQAWASLNCAVARSGLGTRSWPASLYSLQLL